MKYETVEKALRARGLRASDLSKATGISPSTLTDWKKGRITTPTAATLQKIADFLGVTADFLLTGEQQTEAGYYTDPETAKVAQEILDDPHLRALFSAARDSRPEDLETAAALLRRFKETNPDG